MMSVITSDIAAAVMATRNHGVTEPMWAWTDGYGGAVRRPARTDWTELGGYVRRRRRARARNQFCSKHRAAAVAGAVGGLLCSEPLSTSACSSECGGQWQIDCWSSPTWSTPPDQQLDFRR